MIFFSRAAREQRQKQPLIYATLRFFILLSFRFILRCPFSTGRALARVRKNCVICKRFGTIRLCATLNGHFTESRVAA